MQPERRAHSLATRWIVSRASLQLLRVAEEASDTVGSEEAEEGQPLRRRDFWELEFSRKGSSWVGYSCEGSSLVGYLGSGYSVHCQIRALGLEQTCFAT